MDGETNDLGEPKPRRTKPAERPNLRGTKPQEGPKTMGEQSLLRSKPRA